MIDLAFQAGRVLAQAQEVHILSGGLGVLALRTSRNKQVIKNVYLPWMDWKLFLQPITWDRF